MSIRNTYLEKQIRTKYVPNGVLYAAWLAQARSQGDTFFALCHEAGGRHGRGCEIFLDQLCSVAAASQWLSGSMRFSDCTRPLSEE